MVPFVVQLPVIYSLELKKYVFANMHGHANIRLTSV